MVRDDGSGSCADPDADSIPGSGRPRRGGGGRAPAARQDLGTTQQAGLLGLLSLESSGPRRLAVLGDEELPPVLIVLKPLPVVSSGAAAAVPCSFEAGRSGPDSRPAGSAGSPSLVGPGLERRRGPPGLRTRAASKTQTQRRPAGSPARCVQRQSPTAAASVTAAGGSDPGGVSLRA